jgi:pimeloyl-ACP methyl ester carboxylesterase
MQILFLPGAGGAAAFWHPVGSRLPSAWRKFYLNWPGLGNEPAQPGIDSVDSLVRLVEPMIDQPTAIVAQSMGGIVAIRLALRRSVHVKRLVLVATSGGIDLGGIEVADWRADYEREYPNSARWILNEKPDHTADIGKIDVPALLIWGERDSISPPAVGRRLEALLPNARLEIVRGGGHGVAKERPDEVAVLIERHLSAECGGG